MHETSFVKCPTNAGHFYFIKHNNVKYTTGKAFNLLFLCNQKNKAMKELIKTPKTLKAISYYRNAKTNKLTIILKVCFALCLVFTAFANVKAQGTSAKYFNNLNDKGVI